jgi:hypothetical protein
MLLAQRFFQEGFMEKILVAMDPTRPNHFAGIHALNLARRISARVLFLLVLPSSSKHSHAPGKKTSEQAVKRKIDALITEARLDGVAVDYYLVYGDYEREVLNFAKENQITLLVIEPPGDPGNPAETANTLLNKLRHSINCRIEVVNEKHRISERKE